MKSHVNPMMTVGSIGGAKSRSFPVNEVRAAAPMSKATSLAQVNAVRFLRKSNQVSHAEQLAVIAYSPALSLSQGWPGLGKRTV
jgi:hypothetical protein